MNEINIGGAEKIGIPKGDDKEPCIQAFEAVTGIEVPRNNGRGLFQESQGVEFYSLKGKDIAGLVDAGVIDVGLTGTDSYYSYANSDQVDMAIIGEAMCSLDLMCMEDDSEVMDRDLGSTTWTKTIPVATDLPMYVDAYAMRCDVPLRAFELPTGMTISGSYEVMPRLLKRLGVKLIADRVDTGETARANGLVNLGEIAKIYPSIVTKKPAQEVEAIDSLDIDMIDATLSKRSRQIGDRAVKSYTLGLMRDDNKATKKLGEEFAEVMRAVYGEGGTRDCENEIADMLAFSIVLARSRNKPVQLGNVLRILIERNQKAVSI